MNWFWFRSRHRRVTSAGGLAHDSAGQPAWRKAARRLGYAWLGVVLAAAAAGCTGSPGSTGQGQAATAASSPVFVSKTAPGTPVGRQLTWFLRAVGQLPWSRQVIQAHFGAGFLAQSSPAQINSVTEQILAAEGMSLSSSGASLTGLLCRPGPRPGLAPGGGRLRLGQADGEHLGRPRRADQRAVAQPVSACAGQLGPGGRELARLAPNASLLAARVSPGGHCTPVHQVAAAAARPLASMFKLFVLGALAHQIAAGRVSWNQELTVTDALKSPGSGSLQDVRSGTRVSVRQTAAMMIAISDNTAADMLIHLVGRAAVQAQDRQWSGHAALNVPFLTAREGLLMKIYPALANRYLSLAPSQRTAFLASKVDPLPFGQAQAQTLPGSPTDIDTIEYFASPDDICRAFAGLQQLAAQPKLAPLGPILSAAAPASGSTRRSGPPSGSRAAPNPEC